jgi:hypothetical protein
LKKSTSRRSVAKREARDLTLKSSAAALMKGGDVSGQHYKHAELTYGGSLTLGEAATKSALAAATGAATTT